MYPISHEDMILRLLLWLVLAVIIGLEREYRNQPAWLRTHVLIGVGSTLIMILSIMVPELYNSNINDPGRIAAQVVSGVWFLGAGAIIKMGMDTKGLTTAANIWATAAIWLTVGAGLYFAAIFTTFIILFNLIFINKVKKLFLHPTRYCNIDIKFDKKKMTYKKALKQIEKLPIEISKKTIKEDNQSITISILSRILREVDVSSIHKELKSIDSLSEISVSERIV